MGWSAKVGGWRVGGFWRWRKRFRTHASIVTLCEAEPPYENTGRWLEVSFGPLCVGVSWPSKVGGPWRFFWSYPASEE